MNEVRSARGAAARLSGCSREVLAAIWLRAKGYRTLGFRLKAPQAKFAALSGAAVRLDLMALAPGKLPGHIPDARKGE